MAITTTATVPHAVANRIHGQALIHLLMGNGKKRELPVLFWPKTGVVPENNNGRECCWPYLIDQEGPDAYRFFFTHPFSPVVGQKQPVALDYCYFAQLPPVLAISCSLPAGYSNRPNGVDFSPTTLLFTQAPILVWFDGTFIVHKYYPLNYVLQQCLCFVVIGGSAW